MRDAFGALPPFDRRPPSPLGAPAGTRRRADWFDADSSMRTRPRRRSAARTATGAGRRGRALNLAVGHERPGMTGTPRDPEPGFPAPARWARPLGAAGPPGVPDQEACRPAVRGAGEWTDLTQHGTARLRTGPGQAPTVGPPGHQPGRWSSRY
ncbi:hypothetical protein HBB16_12205 [Pseudonocardia sp. MCCB 268]|nr:hypothetical protein [Pseudonocardia cytotoxica]